MEKAMTHLSSRGLVRTAAALACLSFALGAQAQSSRTGSSMIPYTTSSYIGLNVGSSDYHAGCAPGLSCDDTETAAKIFVGGMFNDMVGLELGYVHLGEVDRNGGVVRAHGVNISLVGQVPMSSPVLLVGRVGTIYGRTKNESTAPGYSGTGTAWKPAWGVGVGYRFNPQWAVMLDWDQYRFDFPNGSDRVDSLTLGVRASF
jgi:OOP family OmpA-OmpF porin